MSWTAGSNHTITWTHNYGTTGTFDIDLSADGGATWTSVATGVPASTATAGTYTGALPMLAASTTALVRVSASGQSADPTQSDTSDVPFTLVAPTITVTVPNTAVGWRVGDVKNLQFTDNFGTGEVVSLDLSRNNGASWTSLGTLTTTASASGTLPWTVTGPLTSQALIRATSVANPSVTDVSNVDFSILSRVTVTAPNTAVSWTAGSNHTITWTHNYGTTGTFDIDVSADGGATWNSMAPGVQASTATAGTFTGPLPMTVASTAALVRVSASGQSADPTQSDTSDVPFTLVAPTITVTVPNTAVSWRVGDVKTLTFTDNFGTGEVVSLDITRDGATWTSLTQLTTSAAASGSFSWTVTGPLTAQARIRATWVTNPSVTDVSNANFSILSRVTVTAPEIRYVPIGK